MLEDTLAFHKIFKATTRLGSIIEPARDLETRHTKITLTEKLIETCCHTKVSYTTGIGLANLKMTCSSSHFAAASLERGPMQKSNFQHQSSLHQKTQARHFRFIILHIFKKFGICKFKASIPIKLFLQKLIFLSLPTVAA